MGRQTKPGSEHRMKTVILLFITALTIQSMKSNGDCPEKAVKLTKDVRMICNDGEWEPVVKKRNKKGRISSPPCEDNLSLPAGSCSADAGHCHQHTEDGARMERDCAGTCDTCDSCRCQDSSQWFKYCPYWAQYCASPGVLGVWMTENCKKTCNKCKCNCCSYKGEKHWPGDRIPLPDKCGELLCQEGLMAEDSPWLSGASHHNISHPEELTLVFKSKFPGSHCCILPADAQEEDGNIARNQSMVQEGWTGKIAKDGVTLEATCCHGVLSVPLRDSAFVKLSSSTTTGECPDGWLMYEGKCYGHPKDKKLSWADAESYCQSWSSGAHLASIHSEELKKFVNDNFPWNLWLGGSDIDKEGSWVWSDGTLWSYSAWHPGPPLQLDNYLTGQDCLVGNWHVGGEGNWDDGNCEGELLFLCKK